METTLRREYGYAFAENKYPGAPEWRVHNIDGHTPFRVHSNANEEILSWERGFGYHHLPPQPAPDTSVEIVPIQGWHHREKILSVLGYRFGNIAYLTDIKTLDSEAEFDKLKGVDYVTLGCVKIGDHYSHPSLQDCLDFFEKVGPKEAYITHLSHLLPSYDEFDAMLPQKLAKRLRNAQILKCHQLDNTSLPVSVMRMVFSHCAESFRSLVRTVQWSPLSTSTSFFPSLIIGSTVSTMPGTSSMPVSGFVSCDTKGSRWNFFPTPWPPKSVTTE